MQLHHDQLAVQATMDSLTGAGNRRLFDETITQSVLMRNRDQTPSSLIMLDIDHFKKINDRFGHVKGDEVLVNLVALLRSRLRQTDGLYRLGGEEFAVVANQTSADVAAGLAEELRLLVENESLLPSDRVTISLGVAECMDSVSGNSWVEDADAALYRAKNSGRNKVCLERGCRSTQDNQLSRRAEPLQGIR
jgi:diguanylate cyclase (GGDEF)-like protein